MFRNLFQFLQDLVDLLLYKGFIKLWAPCSLLGMSRWLIPIFLPLLSGYISYWPLLFFVYSISSNDSIDNNLENHGNVHLINDRSDWNAKLQDATSNGKVVCHDDTHTVIILLARNQNHHGNTDEKSSLKGESLWNVGKHWWSMWADLDAWCTAWFLLT